VLTRRCEARENLVAPEGTSAPNTSLLSKVAQDLPITLRLGVPRLLILSTILNSLIFFMSASQPFSTKRLKSGFLRPFKVIPSIKEIQLGFKVSG